MDSPRRKTATEAECAGRSSVRPCVRIRVSRPATASLRLFRPGSDHAAFAAACGLTLALLAAPVTPARAEQPRAADHTPCVGAALLASMNKLSVALDAAPLRLSDQPCPAQEKVLVSLTERAQAKLTAGSEAMGARRLAIASLSLSALALLSAPVVTLALFRRYGLISWRPRLRAGRSNHSL